jgi:hypothetical protein
MSPSATPRDPRRAGPGWRHGAALALSALLLASAPAQAQVSIGVELPGISIGVNVPLYPRLERVADYPVYYAPDLPSNYFFYDGLYWVFTDDDWYSSTWFDGPWRPVGQQLVPAYLLRVPVRYYRSQPPLFRGWQADAPPRWGAYWGSSWQRQRDGWDRWDRGAMPPPAPLPRYQRNYSAERYPRADEQQTLQRDHYQYRPREAFTRQHVELERAQPPRANRPDRFSRDSQPPEHQPRQGRGEPDRAPMPRPVPREDRGADQDGRPGPDGRFGPTRDRGPDPDRGNGRGRGDDRDREQGREQGR